MALVYGGNNNQGGSTSSATLLSVFAFLAILLCLLSTSPSYAYDISIDASTDNCSFCLEWSAYVIPQIPVNSSTDFVNGVLAKSCDHYKDPNENGLCNEYSKKISESSSEYSEFELQMGVSPEVICINLKQCTFNCCLTEQDPEQVHLAIFNETAYSVMWTTLSNAVGYVRWSDGRSSSNATSEITTFTAGGWVGYLHLAFMTDLKPTNYTYVVGNENAWSSNFSFAFPNITDTSSSLLFAFVADMGTDDCSDSTVQSLINETKKANPVQFIIHGGDIAYSVDNSFILDEYNRKIQPFASVVPYMTAVGNHEKFYNFTNYLERYFMPYENSGGPNNFWYSWNWGPVHFLVYSSEHDTAPGSPQYEWIHSDLETNSPFRSQRPWLIAIGHRMVYCSADNSNCDQSYVFRNNLEPLFEAFGVDFVMNGHSHSYERMYPVYQNETAGSYSDPKAAVYINNGCGGAHANSNYCDYDSSWIDQPEWSAVRYTIPGYAVINITANQLNYRMMGSDDGKIHDEVTFTRRQSPYGLFEGGEANLLFY